MHLGDRAVVRPSPSSVRRSRAVISKIAPGPRSLQRGVPFMTFRKTTLASGIPARICRISFSGELAFEINVAAWYGPHGLAAHLRRRP